MYYVHVVHFHVHQCIDLAIYIYIYVDCNDIDRCMCTIRLITLPGEFSDPAASKFKI